MTQKIHDPDLYARLSVPYKTKEEAKASVEEFFRFVNAAREKCRIPELLVMALVRVEGEPETSVRLVRGDSLVLPKLAAIAYGLAKQDQIRALDSLVSQSAGMAESDLNLSPPSPLCPQCGELRPVEGQTLCHYCLSGGR
jgi:hypothetical protein